MDMDADHMSVELNLAAAMALLSSTALRGPTPAKAKALRMHLRAISQASDITADLRSTAASLLATWESVECHPASRTMASLTEPALMMAGSPTTH